MLCEFVRLLRVLALVLAAANLAACDEPQVSCGEGEGVQTTYEARFRKVDSHVEPSLVRIAQVCAKGPAIYVIKGMPGRYHSQFEIRDAFEAFLMFHRRDLSEADMKAGLEFGKEMRERLKAK